MRRGLSGSRRGGRHLYAEVNVINLVDVVLVLLIIFMVTAPMMISGVKVQLPRAVSEPLDLKETLLVTVTGNGQFALGDTPMSFDRFAAAFRTRVGLQRPRRVAIQGDRRAQLDWLLQAMTLARSSGIQEVGIVTTPITTRP